MKRSEIINFVREQDSRIRETFNKAIETKSDATHGFIKKFWELLIPAAYQKYGNECLEWELPFLWETANIEGEINAKKNQENWWRRAIRPVMWRLVDFVAETSIGELPVEHRKPFVLGLFAASLYLNCRE